MSGREQAWEGEIARRRARGALLEFDPADFAASMGSTWPDNDFQNFLSKTVLSGHLTKIEAWRCPVERCQHILDAGMVANGECPYCSADFRKEGVEPEAIVRYRIVGAVSRDIHWMIVVHGMNSRAPWQEDFSWRIANKLKYSAPILIYKYGWATIDVLVVWRHRQLARVLGERIQRAVVHAAAHGITDPPDIVVHSFGSRLFMLVLNDPDFSELSFGRVICAGSIVRPDFDWSTLISKGRIEAVLNHVAGRDGAVPLAQFLIPGSGPGGKVGYLDKKALNVLSPEFGHSSCFSETILDQNLAEDGIWSRFLSYPLANFAANGAIEPKHWRPACAPLRWLARAIGVLIFTLLAPFSALRRLIDP